MSQTLDKMFVRCAPSILITIEKKELFRDRGCWWCSIPVKSEFFLSRGCGSRNKVAFASKHNMTPHALSDGYTFGRLHIRRLHLRRLKILVCPKEEV
jgi:hypothetical protein